MIVIKGADLFGKTADIAVDGDRVAEVGDVKAPKGATVVDARGLTALPAFVDMHVPAAPRSPEGLRLCAACPTPSP